MSHCTVYAITNQKGGVGKTTTTVNLGIGLAKAGKKVLLIDFDPQASLTASLGYKQPDELDDTISTVLEHSISDKPMARDYAILHHDEGVDFIPSNIELSELEVRLINTMSREQALREYLDSVKENYDYILIDCMPSLGVITINALVAADRVKSSQHGREENSYFRSHSRKRQFAELHCRYALYAAFPTAL